VPHSHDAADSIDDALEASTLGFRAVKPDFVGDHRDVADCRGDHQRFGGVVGRHDPQLLRRVDRGPVVVRAVPTRGDAALHLRLRTRGGPGWAIHRDDDHVVGGIGRIPVDPPVLRAGTVDESGLGVRGRADRVRRQRAGRRLSDPDGPPHPLRGAGRRRPARPHRRVHLAGRGTPRSPSEGVS
jgi:hypothetical protein